MTDELELSIPEATHLCLACGMCFHTQFNCCSSGKAVWEIPTLAGRLRAHGLHLVTDADLRVLEAMKEIPTGYLQYLRVEGAVPLSNLAVEELARRGEKP